MDMSAKVFLSSKNLTTKRVTWQMSLLIGQILAVQVPIPIGTLVSVKIVKFSEDICPQEIATKNKWEREFMYQNVRKRICHKIFLSHWI